MNICFLSGKIINEVDLQFVYGNKKVTSIIELELLLEDNQKINVYGYNEMADFIYRNINKNDIILIKGYLSNNKVEIDAIAR